MWLRVNYFILRLMHDLVLGDGHNTEINTALLAIRILITSVVVGCSVELDQKQGKIIIFDTSKGLDSISISGWYVAI